MHTRLRMELIIERMAYKRAGRILEAAGMTGYTVLPAMAGFGRGNHWRRDTDISTSTDMVVMISIGDKERIDACLKEIEQLLGEHIGLISVSDVQILRPERF